MAHYHNVIIGGGHNGLVTAAYLARAGLSTLLLERRPVLGGCSVTEEVFPGFKFSVCSYIVSLLRPDILRDLELPRHGLEIVPLPSTFCPSPHDDGRYILRTDDGGENYRHIKKLSAHDAEALPLFSKQMTRICRFVKPILSMVPPPLDTWNPLELIKFLDLGKRFRDLGPDLFHDVIRLFTMSAVDYLDDWFESEQLKASMAVSGIIGTYLGVRSPGTAYVLLHHYMGEIDGVYRAWGMPMGGMGSIAEALARSARSHGAEIRTGVGVQEILVERGRTTGVILDTGEKISAEIVASGVDPHNTFTRLMDPRTMPEEFRQGLDKFKYRGSSGKVNLAVDRLPSFRCLPGRGKHLHGDISIAPSVDYLEQAYDDAKHGDFSRKPFINVVFPSVIDPSMAPPGKHVVSCFVQYAPYHLKEGNWDDKREPFGDAVVNVLEDYMPGLKASILHRQVVTPLDLEREFGLTEGNIFHGELSLEQMFFLRPLPAWARYRTPVQGLYLCGSGVHPGGGVMGSSGQLGAKEILNDLGRQKLTHRGGR